MPQAVIDRAVKQAVAAATKADRGRRLTSGHVVRTGASLAPSREEMERVVRIRGQLRARRRPFLLWLATVVVAAAVWGVSSAVAAIYGHWPATIVALSAGVLVLAATGITRAVKASALAGTHWSGRVWAAGVCAAATVTTAGLWGPSWQMLGFTVFATWVLAAAWWRAHRITGATPPPPVNDAIDMLEWHSRQFAENLGCKGGPLAGARLTGGQEDEHGYEWALELKPGSGGLHKVRARLDEIETGLRADMVMIDRWPFAKGERKDPSILRLQIITRSPVEETVPWTEPVLDGYRIGLGPYADGDGWAYLTLYDPVALRLYSVVVIGSTGSGKSDEANLIVVSQRKAMPTCTLYVDPKTASSPSLARAASGTVLDPDEFEDFTDSAKRLVDYRQTVNAINRTNQFTVAPDWPAVVIVLDECDALFNVRRRNRNELLARTWGYIAKTGSSCGVALLPMSQDSGQGIFGNDELLRSNIKAGTRLGKRTMSNTAGPLFDTTMGDLRTLPEGGGWGYVRGRDTRDALYRAAWLPSPKNCPDGFNADVAFSMWPDAPLDPGSRAALGERWFDGETRRAEQQEMLQRRISLLTNGVDLGPLALAPASTTTEDGLELGAVPEFPEAIAALAGGGKQATREPAPLTGVSAQIVDEVNKHPDGISPGMVAFPLGLSPNSAATYLGRLVGEGHVRKLARGLFGPITTVTTPAAEPVAGERQPRAYARARETPIVDTPQPLSVVIAGETDKS